jgi:hypothetical protein
VAPFSSVEGMHTSLHMHGVEVVALAILGWLFFFSLLLNTQTVSLHLSLDATIVSLFLSVLQGYSRISELFIFSFFAGQLELM